MNRHLYGRDTLINCYSQNSNSSESHNSANLNASDISPASYSTKEGKEESVTEYGQAIAQKLVLLLKVFWP